VAKNILIFLDVTGQAGGYYARRERKPSIVFRARAAVQSDIYPSGTANVYMPAYSSQPDGVIFFAERGISLDS